MKLKVIFFLSVGCLGAISYAKNQTAVKSQKYFVLFDDGCEHPVASCEAKTKLPTGLKKKKDFSGESAYQGTIQVEFADKNEAGINAYEHYFSDSKSCDRALKKENCGPAGEGD